MNKREQWFRYTAAVASVLAHALIVVPLLDQPIGTSQAALFQTPAQQQYVLIESFRALDDQIVTDDGDNQPDPLLSVNPNTPDATAQQIRDTSKQLLDRTNIKSLAPQPPTPIDPQDIAPDPVDPEAPTGGNEKPPGDSELIDVANRLVSAVSPPLDLPKFIAPTDTVDVPAPTQGRIDIGRATNDQALVDAMAGAGGQGTGNGAGFGAGFNPFAAGAPVPPPLPADPVDPKPPVDVNLPPIDTTPAPVDVAQDNKPTVNLDTDFDYTLAKWHGDLVISRDLFGRETKRREADGWFEVQIQPKPSLRRLKPLKKDVVYVIDTSSSIGNRWLRAIKLGVVGSLDSLNKGDRFNVVMFREKVTVLEPKGMLDAGDTNKTRASKFIKQAQREGYTDVNQALAKLVRRDLGDDRVYQVIFISDGKPTAGTVGARQIIDVFTRANNLVAGVYCVAVGDRVNESLLGALAYRNKGYVLRPDNAVGATAVIRDLTSRLQYPILKDATFNAAGVDTRRMFPRQPRDVYQHEPISLFGRYDVQTRQITLRITGDSGAKRMTFGTSLRFANARPGKRATADGWATAYLYHLTSEMLRRPQRDRAPLQAVIDQLKQHYGVK
jgi:hypothetical protein